MGSEINTEIFRQMEEKDQILLFLHLSNTVKEIHDLGFFFGDFKPDNLMARSDLTKKMFVKHQKFIPIQTKKKNVY